MRRVLLRILGVWLSITALAPASAQAQIPPSVLPFIDLKCYSITDPNGNTLPPLGFPLVLNHLNPVLIGAGAHPENVTLLDPFQLCVPVAKGGVVPPPDALAFIQYIDLKCYHFAADPPIPLNLPLVLTHQNPVLRDQLPPEQQTEQVFVIEPQKLCVPVAKVNTDGTPAMPPSSVLPSIQFIDQKCYHIVGLDGGPLPPLGVPLHLDHLNPVLTPDVAPPEDVDLQVPQQLCVPVSKNGMVPPPPDLRVIEQIDLKCYDIQGDPLALPQTLFHLDPAFPATLLPEDVLIQEPQQICVPVQKALLGAPPRRSAPN